MGVCRSDPLGYLIKEYGLAVCNYFVSIKAQEYLNTEVPKLADKVQQEFKKTASSIDKSFDSNSQSIKSSFDSAVAQIKTSKPELLEKLKVSQGKTQEQLFGYDSIKNKISQIRSLKDQKLKSKQSQIIKQLQNQKDKLNQNLRDSRPSLPLFDSMPLCIKQKVIQEAEEKFAPEIKKKQTELTEFLSRITNFENLEEEIKKAVGLKEVDQIAKDSDSTFKKVKKMMSIQVPKLSSCFD